MFWPELSFAVLSERDLQRPEPLLLELVCFGAGGVDVDEVGGASGG